MSDLDKFGLTADERNALLEWLPWAERIEGGLLTNGQTSIVRGRALVKLLQWLRIQHGKVHATCVHQPTGGSPAQLLWDPEAKPDGEQIGIAVCVRCGTIFAGLFVHREIATSAEGRLRYVGPFTGSVKTGDS